MSELGQLEAALLGVAQTAVPHATVLQGPQHLPNLAAGSFPAIYSTLAAKAPELGAHGSELRTLAGALVVVSDQSMEDARAIGDLVETAIAADRTIGGRVSTIGVSVAAEEDLSAERWSVVLAYEAQTVDGASAITGGPLVRYEISAGVRLRGTTTVAAYLAAIAQAIVAATGAARLGSDLDDESPEAVPPGTSRYQLAAIAAPEIRDSNVTAKTLAMALRVYHRGAAGETERAFTEGELFTQTVAILAPSFWVAGFADVEILPDADPAIDFPGDLVRL